MGHRTDDAYEQDAEADAEAAAAKLPRWERRLGSALRLAGFLATIGAMLLLFAPWLLDLIR